MPVSRPALLLLGPPRIERDGMTVEVDTRKAIALVAYLAVAHRRHTREALATLLWPEYDQSRARAALRRTLSALAKARTEGWLEVDRESVGLNRDELWVDVDRFHGRLAECQTHGHAETDVCPDCLPPLAEAVALYRDDFLAGFGLRDSPNFDDWHFFQAESLRRELAGALERLVRGHEARGEWEAAIAHARRWLALDPLNEPAHRALMQLYAWADQRAAALRQYRECVRVLDKELGVHPVEETTRLYRSIKESEMLPQPVASQHQPPNHRATEGSDFQVLNEASPTTQSLEGPSDGHRQHNLPASRTSFVGRKRELAEVKRELARTRLLTLTGAGGSGKTRLALEVAKDIVGDYSDGVWLVRLAGLSEPKLLPQEVATALGVHEQPNHSLVDTLVDHLQTKDLLLVLDNCEHLIDAAAHLIDAVLSGSQRQQVLATSREPLRVSGEIVRRVPSLSMPDPKNP